MKEMMEMLGEIKTKLSAMAPPLPRRMRESNPFDVLSKLFLAADKFQASPAGVAAEERLQQLNKVLGAARRKKRGVEMDAGSSYPLFFLPQGRMIAENMNYISQAVFNSNICPAESQGNVTSCLTELSARWSGATCSGMEPFGMFLARAKAHTNYCSQRESCYNRLVQSSGCVGDFWDQKWLLCRCSHQLAFDAPEEFVSRLGDAFRTCMTEEGQAVSDNLPTWLRDKIHEKAEKYFCPSVQHPCLREPQTGAFTKLKIPEGPLKKSQVTTPPEQPADDSDDTPDDASLVDTFKSLIPKEFGNAEPIPPPQ